jgi:CheY-like chemotaxis protein
MATPERSTGRPCIVVSDHDPEFLELLVDLLQGEGYDACSAPHAADVYRLVQERHPDAVILDLVYRQESEALTVLDKLTLDPETAGVPVLVCSTTPALLAALREQPRAGGLAVLAKPFDLNALLDAVRGLLHGG